MKLRSRVIRAVNTIKREDLSLQPKAHSEARVSAPDATLGAKQDIERCTLVKQEEPFASTPISSDIQVEQSEEMDMAIKQEETSRSKAALGRYVDTLQGE